MTKTHFNEDPISPLSSFDREFFSGRGGATLLAFLIACGIALTAPSSAWGQTAESAVTPPSKAGPPSKTTLAIPSHALLLITLDTTRADHLGSLHQLRHRAVDDPAADVEPPKTQHLDALAARGTLFSRAFTTSPLTLPAHTSLLTALDPPLHGIRDNGISALSPAIPTLTSTLAARGFATAAFVGSRVLDRRFGLARGFDLYDDAMPAEQVGEYGYPERDAAAVVDAALAWLDGIDSSSPFFLWLHFYDPHAPYEPPSYLRRGNPAADYAGEITFVDQQVGRLLESFPVAADKTLIAVVGDHGEAMEEHGERTHGLLLYRGVLEIPLFLAGPGIDSGKVVDAPVSIRQVAPTLLDLLRIPQPQGTRLQQGAGLPRDQPLPGIGTTKEGLDFVYSETWMPSTAYGWSPLVAFSDDRWRLVVGPRPELFDYLADPRERVNKVRQERRQAGRIRDALEAWQKTHRAVAAAPLEVPADLAASLRSLGYISGQSGTEENRAAPEEGLIDPKDGLKMLAELTRAKKLLSVGNGAQALPLLQDLVAKSPGNVPFLSNLASAQMATGQPKESIATLRRAVKLNPHLDFLHLNLAESHRHLEQWEEAEGEFRVVVDLNPRQASAWLGLAEILHRRGDADGERVLLQQAVEAETHSASIHLRLGQLEAARQRPGIAVDHLHQATRIAPTWPLAWLMLGQSLGQIDGSTAQARKALQEVLRLAPRSREAAQARQLLERL